MAHALKLVKFRALRPVTNLIALLLAEVVRRHRRLLYIKARHMPVDFINNHAY